MKKTFFCPICENNSSFLKEGSRENARCPKCFSLERDRFAWIFLKEKTNFFKKKARLLHVAPELALGEKFSKLENITYLSCDLDKKKAMTQADITNLQFENESFDAIYCSHVLEHVIEDRKAMCEFFRVLSPNGFALLMIPIYDHPTYEDFSVTSPEERTRLFGQWDHVRKYGTDIIQRLESAGFTAELFYAKNLVAEFKLQDISVQKGALIVCKK